MSRNIAKPINERVNGLRRISNYEDVKEDWYEAVANVYSMHMSY